MLGTQYGPDFSDSRDPIFNSRNLNWVHKIPLKNPWALVLTY